LQQRLAAGTNHKPLCLRRALLCERGPLGRNRRRQRVRRFELAAAGAIRVGKIRVAEFANRKRPVLLAARPKIAARKTAEKISLTE
jgi:hypothetical protein